MSSTLSASRVPSGDHSGGYHVLTQYGAVHSASSRQESGFTTRSCALNPPATSGMVKYAVRVPFGDHVTAPGPSPRVEVPQVGAAADDAHERVLDEVLGHARFPSEQVGQAVRRRGVSRHTPTHGGSNA